MNLNKIFSDIIRRLYLTLQPKSDFNEAILELPVYLPKNKYLALLRSIFPYKTSITMRERIVENPFVFMNLSLPEGAKILEVGCCRSRLAVELASLGYKVTANDLKYYKYKHPNLTFIQGDLRSLKIKQKFDGVTSISTIEHTGLGSYNEKRSPAGDVEMMTKIHRLLKKKGLLIITVPFGKYEVIDNNSKIYDYKHLLLLLKKFRILKTEFYKGTDRKYWVPVSFKELLKVSSITKHFIQGVACIIAQK